MEWIDGVALPSHVAIDYAKVLEQCIVKFRSDPDAKIDRRFLAVCLKYVRKGD